MKSFLTLIGAAVLLWALLLGPGWLLQGEQALCQSLVALGLCLLPTIASFAWMKSAKKTPEMQLVAILGGTGIRLGAILGGGLALHELLPEYFPNVFFMWVGVFYIAGLTLEIVLAMRLQPAPAVSETVESLSSAR